MSPYELPKFSIRPLHHKYLVSAVALGMLGAFCLVCTIDVPSAWRIETVAECRYFEGEILLRDNRGDTLAVPCCGSPFVGQCLAAEVDKLILLEEERNAAVASRNEIKMAALRFDAKRL